MWEVIYAYFYNWDGSHDLVLIVYALVELIIAASHQTKDYLIVDIHTQHTSLCSMNAIFICVIVLVKMCFHMLNLCWLKKKKIFECFRCFWKVLCFYKNWKISKTVVTLFWRLSRGSSKSHAIAMSSRVDFDDLVASERSSREWYTEIFTAQLTTPSRVDLPVVKNT